MAFDFPAAPATGDKYQDPTSGTEYVWTGSTWDLSSGGDLSDYVLKEGDVMTGPLTVQADPAKGGIALRLPNGAEPGHIAWLNGDGTRKGYMGAGTTGLDLVLDGAASLNVRSGNIYMQDAGGIHWGSNSAGSSVTDFSKGICLYGYGGTSQFGFNITSGTLNYVVQNTGNKHDFYCGTTMAFRVSNGAIENYSPVNFRAASYAYGALTLISGSHLKVPEGTAIRFHVTDSAISSTDNKAIRYGVAENSWHIFKVGTDTEFTINSGGAGLRGLAPVAADLGLTPDSDGVVNIAKAMIAMLAKIKALETEIATLRK
jgi:hypothetical protein